MLINILSRQAVIEYSKKPHMELSIVISLSDLQNEAPKLLRARGNGILEQLKLNFEDIEFEDARCMTNDHAIKIVRFIHKYQYKVEKIIVSCEAGIRRSAAVAAAIMQHFDGDDWEIFNNPDYCPNIICYRKMLYALNENIDETLIFEKIRVNRELWDKRWQSQS